MSLERNAAIADLSYRDYEGPLSAPQVRWWVIAKMGIMLAIRKKAFWIAALFASWYYLVMITILFFVEQTAASSPEGEKATAAFLGRIVWKDQFLHGFSYAQLVILLTALLIGAGAIANDNRANALLVYLSKPCNKLDYVIGKWVGVFLPLCLMMLVPTLVFYGYGALSYRESGFLRDDPLLLPKMLGVIGLSAALHSSLVLAISTLFNQGRIAGAAYAGLYFLTNFFTQLMMFAFMQGRDPENSPVKTLFYFSIDGIQIGLTKAILGTDGTPPFGIPGRRPAVPAPDFWPFFALVVGVTVLSVLFTWRRVRAVEVV
jgi:ABC-2 type transport system permease protein